MVPNMELVKEVCRDEGYPFKLLGGHNNLAEVVYEGRSYLFSYAATPFNREDVQRVCCDKFLAHSLLFSKINMPRTHQYLKPGLDPLLHGKIEFDLISEITDSILNNFTPSFIIKMNAGSLGRNVFKCKNREDVDKAVAKIFEEDWALLAQELVVREKEFRVMVINDSVELVYTKGGDEFFGLDSEMFEKVRNFLSPIFEHIHLGWAGLDVMLDRAGALWLLEINTKPSLVSAVKAGKKDELKKLYKKAFREILS